jgi:CheY-like chemotaxis protein
MKRILIAEDVEFNRDLLVQLLEEDYELLLAEDGVEAVRMARECSPDLILMDLSLPVMNGWDATRAIKSDDKLRHIPVVALTAHAMKADEDKALAAGCDAYLTKPLDEEKLFDTIRKYTASV